MITRKQLRLSNYDYKSCGFYSVTICTIEKQCILGHIKNSEQTQDASATDNKYECPYDYSRIILSPIGQIVEKHINSIPGINCYCIMPNHIHMIIENSTENRQSLSQKIRSFKIICGKESGITVFQRSFYDHIIRDEEDYLRALKYIYDNPFKWKDDEYYIE